MGEHRISSLNFNERHRTVRRISIHPDYDALTFNYDVALLQVRAFLIFTIISKGIS